MFQGSLHFITSAVASRPFGCSLYKNAFMCFHLSRINIFSPLWHEPMVEEGVKRWQAVFQCHIPITVLWNKTNCCLYWRQFYSQRDKLDFWTVISIVLPLCIMRAILMCTAVKLLTYTVRSSFMLNPSLSLPQGEQKHNGSIIVNQHLMEQVHEDTLL